MRKDYIVLYCKQEMDPINQQQFLDIITNPLTDEQRNKLEEPITITEYSRPRVIKLPGTMEYRLNSMTLFITYFSAFSPT